MNGEPSRFAGLADDVLAAAPRLGRSRLVCVDGPAGSGKTTFAARLAAALGAGAEVVHMDDLYAGWTLTGARARLSAAVLRPLSYGRPGAFRPYDWTAARFAGEAWPVPAADVVVVEGCGSCAPALDRWTSLRVWVEAPVDVRLARGLARDGAALAPQWYRWQALENALFATEGTCDRADLRIDGTADASPSQFTPLG